MNEKNSTYRVEIKNSGTTRNEAYIWQIYRNTDVLPILRSQQVFGSRMAGLADANRSRLQMANDGLAKSKNRKRKWIYLAQRASRVIRSFVGGRAPNWACMLLGTALADDILSLVARNPGLTEVEIAKHLLAVSAISSGSTLPVAD